MSKVKQSAWTAADYERAARKYERTLPLEHFMESLPQSTQRKITLESLDVLHARRSDVQVFNELLIQYFFEGKLRRVVPDNMVRLCDQPPKTPGSFNVELEPVQPLLVLEYVSVSSIRKDYKESFAKYERELRVPYCLMYYPEDRDLQIWRHAGEEYERLPVNREGRHEIAELQLEVALRGDWVRYWHQGELLPLPGDLMNQVDQERQLRVAAETEVARLRALLEKAEGGQSRPRRTRKDT
ncbi:MAG: Uma2 family endonuclease [Gemmataceae bacterium]|nr:Uma2 family endonuclease [Gemmataceae bacterium]